ncbi:hypothetical protein DS901_04075 [Loktanella sp. D2R18]|nr:hypothetical protein DS901_04075 [Loktanella sp. D2R18]
MNLMKKETVWVSRAMSDSTLVKAITCDELKTDPDPIIETMENSRKGKPMPADRFPKRLHGEYRDVHIKKLPDIFLAGGFWVVSAACADVLCQFDLGQTALYPVEIFQYDKKTRVEGDYFHLAFGEVKNVFEPDETPDVRVASALRNPKPNGYWRLNFTLSDGDTAVNKSALEGVGLWIDPSLLDIFFMSDALVQALKAAKLTRRFGLRKCRVVAQPVGETP